MAAVTSVLLASFAIPVRAQVHDTAALAGQVSSAEESQMEGVLVTAQKAGSTISVTVFSDARGRYRFPSNKLASGTYSIRIRAVGYDLASSGNVEIAAGKQNTADLKLRKTTNLGAQLTNLEWLSSFPGTPEQHTSIQQCTHCHTLERVARSQHDSAEFDQLINRMLSYPASSFPLMPQPRTVDRRGGGPMTPEMLERQQETRHKMAEYLSTVNLSASQEWAYPLKTSPRPAGSATKVIITEYDLPKRTRQPHDVIVDANGMVWYASFGEQILGKLDPATGKVTEYSAPMPKPNEGTGTLALRSDRQGSLWMGMISQGAIAKFDPRTEKFQTFSLPPDQDANYREFDNIATSHNDVDGKIWFIDSGTFTVYRLDLASGKYEHFEPFQLPRPNIYDIASDSHNNAYFTVFGGEQLGRIDAKTGEVSFYKTPTLRSGPRRINIDAQDRAWFSENRGDKVGMFDIRTSTFKEWAPLTPGYLPYSATGDTYGNVWAVTEYTDRVMRVNSKSGETVEYLLPRHTNMRSVFVDDSAPQVKFWVGSNHGASIVKLEPLD